MIIGEEFEVQFADCRSNVSCVVMLGKKNKELKSLTRFILFCTEYGAEDITVLRDGLAFISTVCY